MDKTPVIKSARKTIVDQIKEESKKPADSCNPKVEFLSTGSTTVNLMLSGKGKGGGWARQHIGNAVGDGATAKTLLMLETAAHTLYTIRDQKSELFPPVKNVSVVYNNIEGVMDFPIAEMYGEDFINQIEWVQTPTAEAFGKDYLQRVKALKKGDFLLYIIDSIDALTSEAGAERMAKILSDKKPDGSYGTEKAKFFSSDFFSHLCGAMEGKDATLLCVSQIREKIGVTFGEKHYRTGGKALDFYTHQVVWLAQIKKLKRTFRSQERVYGVRIKANCKRNKVAKPFRQAEFTVLFDYGIDDVGSMVDYLYGPEVKKIDWNSTEFKRNEFIEMIESDPANENKLRELVEQDWAEIEAAVVPERKKRWEV